MTYNFDYLPAPVDLSDYLRPLPMPPGGYPDGKCQRCGRTVPPSTSRNKVKREYCCELCRKRAERARWKKRVRARKAKEVATSMSEMSPVRRRIEQRRLANAKYYAMCGEVVA